MLNARVQGSSLLLKMSQLMRNVTAHGHTAAHSVERTLVCCLCFCVVPSPIPQPVGRVGGVPWAPFQAPSASCPGLGFAGLSLAPARVLGGEIAKQQFLHKAALFSANPPRSGMHFFQMIQQHVNGKG